MADLKQVQDEMLDGIVSREGVPALPFIVGDATLDAAGRLGIYNDMYFSRLVDTLTSTFPKLAARLGECDFSDLTADYVTAYPSRHPSLRWLGQQLPRFLEESEADDWVVDLARLEWARSDVFDARDEKTLSVADLQALDPQSFAALPVRLIEAHRRVDARTAVEQVWRGGEPGPGPRTLLVWRQDVEVYHRALDALEAQVLPAQATPFGVVCERVAEVVGDDQAAGEAFRLLGRWVQDGLLVA